MTDFLIAASQKVAMLVSKRSKYEDPGKTGNTPRMKSKETLEAFKPVVNTTFGAISPDKIGVNSSVMARASSRVRG